jgi:hypothetical protein
VVIRGFADSGTSYCDRVFILATRDNTLVSINGGPEQPLSAGQQISHSMPGALTATVVSDSAVYVYQLSGFGNADGATERGAALLPSMYSIGSRRIIFDKSAGSYNNRVMVLVRAGSEGDFTVNGSSSVLKATDFTAVSGMSDWMYARKDISSVANGFIDVVNGTGAFSLGYFYSGSTDNRTSASFGYFSAYGDFKFPGDGITWMCGSGTVLAGSYAKSYKWFFNGEEIAGETGSSLTVTQEGVYKIEMDQDGATVKDSTEVRKVRAGTVCANQYICTGTSPAELSVSGSSGDIYQWQSCLDGPDGSWADIEGATSAAYTPEPLTQTTYYRRGTAASQCAPVYSGGMEVKVSPCVVPVNPHLRTRAVR